MDWQGSEDSEDSGDSGDSEAWVVSEDRQLEPEMQGQPEEALVRDCLT